MKFSIFSQGKKISDALSSLKNLISDVSMSSRHIRDQFEKIFSNTQEVSSKESVIKSAMDEQTAGSQQILNVIHDINSHTDSVKNGITEMSKDGHNALVEIEKLAGVSVEIAGNMDKISSEISEITNSVSDVNELSQRNKDSIGKVTTEINKFKI